MRPVKGESWEHGDPVGPAYAARVRLIACTVLCCLACLGCRTFPGHPVRLSAPRLEGPAPAPASDVPEPGSVPTDAVASTLFLGLEGVLTPLQALRERAVTNLRKPELLRLAKMERSVRRRYRRGGFGGAVRNVVVLGVVGVMPLTPAQAADLITNPETERAVLGAQALWPLETVYALPEARRARYRAHMLQRGVGPIRYDLRFTFAMERRDGADGCVYLRYDPDVQPKPEHVTLFRGGCVLEPVEGGTRVTEILILGTDIQLLPMLQGEVIGLVLKTMADRATNLWVRAWRGR